MESQLTKHILPRFGSLPLEGVDETVVQEFDEGARFIDLAKKLRFWLLNDPDHPAKNLAELDTVIWLAYGKKNDRGTD
jgi:hypothetical protein